MTLTFIGNKEDIESSFFFLWEEAGLYFDITSTSFDSGAQEYDINFPAKDFDITPLVIKIGGSFYPLVKEKLVLWIERPRQHYIALIDEIRQKCIEYLDKELQDIETMQILVHLVFEQSILKK